MTVVLRAVWKAVEWAVLRAATTVVLRVAETAATTADAMVHP